MGNPNIFQNFLNTVGRSYGQVDKKIFNGILPGGAASVVSPIRQQVNQAVTNTTKQVAGAALNQLPDRANLFGRYITGVGNTNLQLDPSTLSDLRRAASPEPITQGTIPNPFKIPEEVLTSMQQQLKNTNDKTNSPLNIFLKKSIEEGIKNKNESDFISGSVYGYGPGVVQSGPVRPYRRTDVGNSVTNTLGSYNVQVDPGKTITFKDTYDMVNPSEDPDLVSGKFQPMKAIEEIQSIWDPTKGHFGHSNNSMLSPKTSNQYGQMQGTKSSATSPATALGRALLYALPVKPTPYDINITVPY